VCRKKLPATHGPKVTVGRHLTGLPGFRDDIHVQILQFLNDWLGRSCRGADYDSDDSFREIHGTLDSVAMTPSKAEVERAISIRRIQSAPTEQGSVKVSSEAQPGFAKAASARIENASHSSLIFRSRLNGIFWPHGHDSQRILAANWIWRCLRFVSILPSSLAAFSTGADRFELPCTLRARRVPMCTIPRHSQLCEKTENGQMFIRK
jgi:hypothetical protein